MSELYNLSTLLADANLKAYYRAEDVNDYKTSYNLTNYNSVAFNPAKYGNGFDFGAINTDKYLMNATNLGFNNGPCSFPLWLKISTQVSATYLSYLIFHRFDDVSFTGQGLSYDYNSGTPRLTLERWRNGVQSDYLTHDITLTAGCWYHIAYVYDNTNIKLYLNGTYIKQLASNPGNGIGATGVGNKFFVGRNGYSPVSYLNGMVDDFPIFNRALIDSEILGLAKDPVGGSPMFMSSGGVCIG